MKKVFYASIIFFFIMFVSINVSAAQISAEDGFDVCTKSGIVKTFQLIGYCFFVIKIIVPILLMGLGVFDLSKAVLSSDEKAIKTSINIITKRAIASVVIFFLPTIIAAVMNLMDSINDLDDFNCLSNCIAKPIDDGVCVIPNNIMFNQGD